MQLAEHFLEEYAKEENKNFTGFANDTTAFLNTYAWPGNIRQLQNLIRNTVVMNSGPIVTKDMLPTQIVNAVTLTQGLAAAPVDVPSTAHPVMSMATLAKPPKPNASPLAQPETIRPLAEVERDAIEAAIALCDGNIPRAAAALGVSPSTLYRKRQGWEPSIAS